MFTTVWSKSAQPSCLLRRLGFGLLDCSIYLINHIIYIIDIYHSRYDDVSSHPRQVYCCTMLLFLEVSLRSRTAIVTLPTGTIRTQTRFFFPTDASVHTHTHTHCLQSLSEETYTQICHMNRLTGLQVFWDVAVSVRNRLFIRNQLHIRHNHPTGQILRERESECDADGQTGE